MLATTLQRIMHRLQTVSVIMNLILIAATMIALPVGKHLSSERNDAKYIFTQSANLTTWPTGWAFMLAWMSPIWTIGDFDSCVHISEEAGLHSPTHQDTLLNVRIGLQCGKSYTVWNHECHWGLVDSRLSHHDRSRGLHQPRSPSGAQQSIRTANGSDILRCHWKARCHGNDGASVHLSVPNGTLYSKKPPLPLYSY